jgi:cytochrome c peroxidase
MLFFDPRLSGNGTISCATCHNPLLGWSDGLSKGIGINGALLDRSSPTIINAGFNYLQMWDGRKKSLEEQAIGPMDTPTEMHTNFKSTLSFLTKNNGYSLAFTNAYPDEGIDRITISKAIASFERTIVSNNSPFDQWIRGDKSAITKQQISGFKVFLDPNKGNCEVCHSAPNFVDDGFHNIGLKGHDLGRYPHKKVKVLKGAFKTPTLRDISLSAPYFHNGSAATLSEVVEHYVKGGDIEQGLDPNIFPLNLTEQEKRDLVAFMSSLTTKQVPFKLPILPLK